jgi:Kef-type K+ transport system membrane component KefB/mannitol/fructose-specific phosphotransferase system IIA component (Ntr-type)
MTEHDVIVFLASLAVLLGAARLLGEASRALGLPLVVGEIAAGILLGPTVFGQLAPRAQHWLFPDGTPAAMTGAYSTVAVVLLLVVVGVEVDLGVLRRRGRTALATGLLGIVLPAACGVMLGFLLPPSDLLDPSKRTIVALLLGVALSISALPVIARTLLDLGLFKTDVGLLVMAAAMIDDVAGWLALSLLLGPLRGARVDLVSFGRTVILGAMFVVATLVVGPKFIDAALARLQRGTEATGRVLSLIMVVALLGAAATHAIGLHAVLGGFVVGLSLGRSSRIYARTRLVVEDFVRNVFAPVFFATIGLRVDFVRAFDVRLVSLVFVLASLPKLVGCTLGSRLGGLGWREATAVGFGMNARGAMGIILAAIARQAGLLRDEMFVALVVMSLATSIAAGPAMRFLLYREGSEEDVIALLRRGAFVPVLRARTPTEAIGELIDALGANLGDKKRAAHDAVLEREEVGPTGMGDEVAIPHAAVEGLEKPMLALGRSPGGIDFDAPDGKAARIVFLLLIGSRAYEEEVRILASMARATFDARARRELMEAESVADVMRAMGEGARRTTTDGAKRPR